MISFLVAIAFTILTSPVWLIIGFLNGLFTSIVELFSKVWWLIKNTLIIEHTLPAEDAMVAIIAIPFYAIWKGIVAFFSTLESFWDWARYEHTLWAFFICLGLTLIYIKIYIEFYEKEK